MRLFRKRWRVEVYYTFEDMNFNPEVYFCRTRVEAAWKIRQIRRFCKRYGYGCNWSRYQV